MKSLFKNSGKSKAEIIVDKDVFTPKESINVNFILDNSESEQSIKRAKVRLIREISALSSNGIEFKEKTILMKRKCNGAQSKQKTKRDI